MVWKYTLFSKIVEKEATDDILTAFSIWKYDNDDIFGRQSINKQNSVFGHNDDKVKSQIAEWRFKN